MHYFMKRHLLYEDPFLRHPLEIVNSLGYFHLCLWCQKIIYKAQKIILVFTILRTRRTVGEYNIFPNLAILKDYIGDVSGA